VSSWASRCRTRRCARTRPRLSLFRVPFMPKRTLYLARPNENPILDPAAKVLLPVDRSIVFAVWLIQLDPNPFAWLERCRTRKTNDTPADRPNLHNCSKWIITHLIQIVCNDSIEKGRDKAPKGCKRAKFVYNSVTQHIEFINFACTST